MRIFSPESRMTPANEWYMDFLSKRGVDVKRQIPSSAETEGYALIFGSLNLSELNADSNYRFHTFFFDARTCQMFGKPFHSAWVVPKNGQCHFNEEVFFHCPRVDEEISLVLEIVENNKNGNSTRSVGWTSMKVQNSNEPMLQYRQIPAEINLKLVELYGGTPKVLTFTKSFKSVKKGVIECQLFSHPSLLRVIDYFPEFCLIGSKQEVPGLYGDSEEAQLASPHPIPQIAASLDEISISFGFNANKIEQVIIEEITKDRAQKDNLPFNVGVKRKVAVIERRLKIGVHNGYCYLSEPLSLSLSCSNQNLFSSNSLLRKRRALSSNDLKNEASTLYLNSRVSLPKFCEDSRLVIVFSLEYLFTVENDTQCSQPILIGWGAWKPCSKGSLPTQVQTSVPLIGGPRPNPEYALCFKNLLHLFRRDDSVFTESAPRITMYFNFFVDQLRPESGISTQRDHGEEQREMIRRQRLQQMEEEEYRRQLEEEEIRRIRREEERRRQEEEWSRRKETEEKERKEEENRMPMLTPRNDPIAIQSAREASKEALQAIETFIEEEIVAEPLYCENTAPTTSRIPLEETRISNIPRAVQAIVSKENFGAVKDRHGESPTVCDVTENPLLSFDVERNDRLDCNEIIFQFLAYKKMILSGGDKPEANVLRRLDRNGKIIEDSPGFLIKYIIERESEDDKDDIIAYLAHCHVVVDAWDAESLIYVGAAIIPLRSLLRRGKEAVQSYVACPVFDSSRPSTTSSNGVLYLRIANIGHPSTLQLGEQCFIILFW
ncbi:unnamed protein product [Caenorhabditis auriculariae]|uniref:NPHP4 C2-like domain-containing protein n=1 Tax=Caenorhabditis auriculariae TaxID=2777116 RepID=A0A8S1GTQ1_9PELO|nr:unnamed protein product [Caenorhabditis auriculariae]